MSSHPPQSVLDAFGALGTLESLPGGEGRSVRVGGIVLKPVDAADEDEAVHVAEILETVVAQGFRVPLPVRARDRRIIVEGWTAAQAVSGEARPQGRWTDLLDAGRAFHRAIRGFARPDWLSRPRHRWAFADRVAWGEALLDPIDPVRTRLRSLLDLIGPVEPCVSQLVHGDLSGNVLFAPGEVPAIIDFSPYWRPPAYADAIVVVDALLWYRAEPGLIDVASSGSTFPQMLVRAALFRLAALNERARHVDTECVSDLPFHDRVIDVLRGRTSGGH